MFAAEYGHLDILELLIKRGADLETKDQVNDFFSPFIQHCVCCDKNFLESIIICSILPMSLIDQRMAKALSCMLPPTATLHASLL